MMFRSSIVVPEFLGFGRLLSVVLHHVAREDLCLDVDFSCTIAIMSEFTEPSVNDGARLLSFVCLQPNDSSQVNVRREFCVLCGELENVYLLMFVATLSRIAGSRLMTPSRMAPMDIVSN